MSVAVPGYTNEPEGSILQYDNMKWKEAVFSIYFSNNRSLQWCYTIVLMLQVSVDFIKSELNSHSEACLTLSHSNKEMADVKTEECPLLLTLRVSETENEVILW
jgi:hypothetical protein